MQFSRMDWTFERFVVTKATRKAYDQAMALASCAATPRALLLCGPPGVGKSHLLQSIVRFSEARDASIVRITAADLVQRLVEGLQHPGWTRAQALQPRLPDLLAVEDAHVLRDRPATQNEIARVFRSVLQAGGRVVCTACCAPADLPCLSELFAGREEAISIELGPIPAGPMRSVVVSLAASGRAQLAVEAVATIAAAARGDVRRAIGALARHRFERAVVPSTGRARHSRA